MQSVVTTNVLRQHISQWQKAGLTVGCVPTMGNLHAGHLKLIELAKQQTDRVVVTIFINSLQFDRADDMQSYPRTMIADQQKLRLQQVDLLFAPQKSTMYPNGSNKQTFVNVPYLSDKLEGKLRSGHFIGVATIVNKLFNLIQPDIAYFGEKDYQQLAVIKAMVMDLNSTVQLVGVPTVREYDGLAISSRNNLLTAEQRQQAPLLAKEMTSLAKQLPNKITSLLATNVAKIIKQSKDRLTERNFKVESIDIVDASSFDAISKQTEKIVILMAAYLGTVRLIDSLALTITR